MSEQIRKTDPLNQNVADDLARFLFGRDLTLDEVTELSALARYENFPEGAVLLSEGDLNHRLFFLVEGSVAIVREGETIAVLKNPGSLLGEMSLITRNPCSASTIANEPTQLLVLEVEKIKGLTLEAQVTLNHILNHLYSVILCQKLAATNEKARLFEITNRELQQAKKALEAASANKIDEISTNHRMVFRKLNLIIQNEITPIGSRLVELWEAETPSRDEIAAIANQMDRLLKDLEPLTRTFEAENLLHKRRVLLVEDDVNEQINAKMSLGGTGVDLTVVGDLEAAQAIIRRERFDIACVNGNFVDLIPQIRSVHPDTKFVFVTSEPIAEHFQTLKTHPELETILARHPNDRTFTVKNTATTIRKLLSRDIFGMDKYLNWGTDIIEHVVMSSEQRPELITKLEDFLDSIGIRGPLKRKSTRVAEELLMNAIYDAPTGKDGKALYNHHDRSTPLHLRPEEYARFRYACDGNFIAVSVMDRFGALTRSLVLNYLERCFNEQIGGDQAGKGGGGNGLFQIIQSSSLTAFNVKPGHQTEVIALLNINIQVEKISTHPSFHFFESTL